MPARILIADDSLSARSYLKRLLESHPNHWKVCGEAITGLEAIQKAVELKADLIILDFQMPFMDGLSASARIARSLPSVPILMNTIHKSPYVDVEAKKAGISLVVSKGEPAALLRAVKVLLAEKSNLPPD